MQKGFEVVNLHGTASGVIAVPVIGENGNWWIGNEDTGIAAQGPKGDRGPAGSGGGADGTPVGTVIAYMSTKVPDHYLACDGAEYSIEDCPLLSNQILDGFGAVDYFGGDGATTFAVPDLRNEFLRGYHGETEEKLSMDVGKHQESTKLPGIFLFSDGKNNQKLACEYNSDKSNNPMENTDTVLKASGSRTYQDIVLSPLRSSSNVGAYGYTSRPTNVAVLYCIKYE